MKKLQRNRLSLNNETVRLLVHNELGNIVGGRIDLTEKLGCLTSECPDTIPVTDACFTITCANCGS